MAFDLQIVNLFYWVEIINKAKQSEMAQTLLSGREWGGQEPDTILQIEQKECSVDGLPSNLYSISKTELPRKHLSIVLIILKIFPFSLVSSLINY